MTHCFAFGGGRRRLAARLVGLFGAFAALALASPLQAAAAEACPNEQFRTGYSAYLPDCRAYELVSPPGIEPLARPGGVWTNFDGGEFLPDEFFGLQASAEGDRLAFFSPYTPIGATREGPSYLFTRGENGWSTESVVPPQSTTNTAGICYNAYAPSYTPDLSAHILADGWDRGEGPEFCGWDEPALVAGEPTAGQNLFLASADGAYQLINVTPAGVTGANAWFQAASSDLSHVAFTEEAALTPEAQTQAGFKDLYEWTGGSVHLITILPDGKATLGRLVNPAEPQPLAGLRSGAEVYTHAVSSDGSRVFFTAGEDLYMRERPYREQSPLDEAGNCTNPSDACTYQVDASQTGGSGGGGQFMWASASGARVFFSDETRLTTNATAAPGKPDLYEYDAEAPVGRRLTDLTVDAAEPATVLGVSGAGEDGSYLYFVAEGAITGPQANSQGATAQAGQPNMYLAHEGAVRFIAALEPGTYDSTNWESPDRLANDAHLRLTARVSPNGQFIAFNSIKSLTGYDNRDASTGEPDQQVYVFDAADDTLSCASCAPSGDRPTAPAHIAGPIMDFIAAAGGHGALPITPTYLQRNVLNDGRVFFDTPSPVLARASNGQSNVYEYENGTTHLLSSGTSDTPSYFLDASASGEDVFILSGQALVPAGNSNPRVYDTRVDGGLPEAGSATVCSEEDCKGAVTPVPLLAAPSSETFSGAGNPGPASLPATKPKKKSVNCSKRRRRSHGRCVRERVKRKVSQRHHRHRGRSK